MKCLEPVAEWIVCQPTQNSVPGNTKAATSSASVIGRIRSALQENTACGDTLAILGQVQGVDQAE